MKSSGVNSGNINMSENSNYKCVSVIDSFETSEKEVDAAVVEMSDFLPPKVKNIHL